MTQLLISVKNVEEALIALTAGVDIIDLKDPQVGALGSLDIDTTAQILQLIQQYSQTNTIQPNTLTSATVGESHTNFDALISDIYSRAKMGIDLVKIAISERFSELDLAHNWLNILGENLRILTDKEMPRTKLVAVFFADELMDFNLLERLKMAGFYGAMLDTRVKHQNLFEVCTKQTLQIFTQICQKNHLKSGLAGSLKAQHVDCLMHINPSYIGFRGGVCEGGMRMDTIAPHKIDNIKNLLHEHNKFNGIAHKSSNLALHS